MHIHAASGTEDIYQDTRKAAGYMSEMQEESSVSDLARVLKRHF